MSDIVLYPFTTPILLTDVLYTQYGGNTANSTDFQRDAAYVIAEEAISRDIDTLPIRTIVTGTYTFNASSPVRIEQNYRVKLTYGYVHRVILTRFIDFEGDAYFTVSGTSNVYVALRDQERGIVDIGYALTNCHCHTNSRPSPYKLQFVYEAGLPSGTAYSPKVMLAATTFANIILNEIVGYGNEAPGDVGVIEYSNQSYREKREKLLSTVYGDSAKANFAWKLLRPLRKRRWVQL